MNRFAVMLNLNCNDTRRPPPATSIGRQVNVLQAIHLAWIGHFDFQLKNVFAYYSRFNANLTSINILRRIIALSNQIALMLKCVDSVKSKRGFKTVKLLYNRFLNNIISYLSLSVLFCIKIFLTTIPLLNRFAVMLNLNCNDTRRTPPPQLHRLVDR